MAAVAEIGGEGLLGAAKIGTESLEIGAKGLSKLFEKALPIFKDGLKAGAKGLKGVAKEAGEGIESAVAKGSKGLKGVAKETGQGLEATAKDMIEQANGQLDSTSIDLVKSLSDSYTPTSRVGATIKQPTDEHYKKIRDIACAKIHKENGSDDDDETEEFLQEHEKIYKT